MTGTSKNQDDNELTLDDLETVAGGAQTGAELAVDAPTFLTPEPRVPGSSPTPGPGDTDKMHTHKDIFSY